VELKALFADSDIELVDCGTAPQPSVQNFHRFFREAAALAQQLRVRNIDLVHCADVSAGFHCGLAGKLARVPVLCHIRNRHDQLPKRDQLFLRAIDYFVFVSQDTWRRFSCRVGRNKGTVLYDGIAPRKPTRDPRGIRETLLSESNLPANSVLIGMTARVSPQKDYETLIKAASIVVSRFPSAFFVVAGDFSSNASNREHYTSLLANLAASGVGDHFRFLGFRPDVDDLLHAFDIFVLSTNHEGLPLAVIEAMACRRPVVATAVDGVPELIEEGRSGFLVPHANADVLANRLCDLIGDDARARQMGDAAFSRVLEKFSEDAFRKNVGALYAKFARD
jgi:glycosyltransferase involved in cell wall biosynthesis